MKILQTLFLLLVLVFVSCGDDSTEDPMMEVQCSALWTIQYADEFDALNVAVMNYSVSPTTENCTALTQAYTGYVNVLRNWEDCARENGVLVDWQEAVSEAERSLMDGPC